MCSLTDLCVLVSLLNTDTAQARAEGDESEDEEEDEAGTQEETPHTGTQEATPHTGDPNDPFSWLDIDNLEDWENPYLAAEVNCTAAANEKAGKQKWVVETHHLSSFLGKCDEGMCPVFYQHAPLASILPSPANLHFSPFSQ